MCLEVLLSSLRIDAVVRHKMRVKEGEGRFQDPTGISEISKLESRLYDSLPLSTMREVEDQRGELTSPRQQTWEVLGG